MWQRHSSYSPRLRTNDEYQARACEVGNAEPAAAAGDEDAERARAVSGLWLWPIVAVGVVAVAGHWWHLAGSVAATATLAAVIAILAELRVGSGGPAWKVLRAVVVVAVVTLLLIWQAGRTPWSGEPVTEPSPLRTVTPVK